MHYWHLVDTYVLWHLTFSVLRKVVAATGNDAPLIGVQTEDDNLSSELSSGSAQSRKRKEYEAKQDAFRIMVGEAMSTLAYASLNSEIILMRDNLQKYRISRLRANNPEETNIFQDFIG